MPETMTCMCSCQKQCFTSKYMRHGHFEGANLRSELWLLGITDWQSDRSVLLRTSSLIRAWRKKKRENKYVESSSSTWLHILLSAFRMVQSFRPRSSCCLDCLPHGYLRRAAGLNITMRLLEQSSQACHWYCVLFGLITITWLISHINIPRSIRRIKQCHHIRQFCCR